MSRFNINTNSFGEIIFFHKDELIVMVIASPEEIEWNGGAASGRLEVEIDDEGFAIMVFPEEISIKEAKSLLIDARNGILKYVEINGRKGYKVQ